METRIDKKEPTIKIVPTTFPTQLVPYAEKKTMEFGLRVSYAILYDWFWRDGTQCRYYDRIRDYRLLKLYARGEQPIDKYKNQIAVDGDMSYLNLDFTPVPIIPKFVDIVVNGMVERIFKPKATAIDAMSQAKRNKYQDLIEGQMVAKPVLEDIQAMTGVNTFVTSPEELPATDEELALYMQLNYKPAIEIAEEEAINTLLEENHWSDTDKRITYDMTVLGIGIGKHQFLAGEGVKIEYVDPENTIYSYTEDPDFKDVFYWGEVKTVPLTELYKIKPDISNEEMTTIQEASQGWYDYYNLTWLYGSPLYQEETTTLLYYNYKTTEVVKYKKKKLENGNSRMIKKDDTFNPPEEMLEEGNFEVLEKTIDVWYDGIMVMGTDIILKWGKSENMVRPKSSTQHALSNYVACAPRMYKGNIDSLTRRMIPFADLIQVVHLKIQQVLSKLVPDGVYLDADGLNEIDLGNGGSYNPQDALRLFWQTGSVIGRSQTQDGEFNHGKVPIQQLTSSSGQDKLGMLVNAYNQYLTMIRDVTGLNEARDGSTPDPRALVGVQKLAAANSNTATRHLLNARLNIHRGISEALTYRVADILQYSDFKEGFANRIGKYNVSLLNEIKELYIYDFGIYIEVSPDEEEKAQLEANIQIALSKGDINLEDAIDIRTIQNIKLANQLLKLKRTKKLERDEKMEMQRNAMIAQQQLKSQELAAAVAEKQTTLEMQGKMALIQEQSKADIAKIEREAELKSSLMKEEFGYNIELQGIVEGNISKRDEMKETAKDKRTELQATQQSELITQRQNNLPPKRFESVGNDVSADISFNDIGVKNI